MRVVQSVRALALAAVLCLACTETAVHSSRGDDAFQALHDLSQRAIFRYLAFMKQGTIPVGYFHDELLRELTSEPVAGR